MESEILKYLSVYFLSCFKFIFGPTLGAAYGFSMVETAVITILGMMTTVVILTFGGEKIRSYCLKRSTNRRRFTKRSRRFVYIWKRYGLFGVAFLTPLIFSPPIGTLLMSIAGGPRRQIFSYMLFSAVFWSIIFTFAIHTGVVSFLY